MKTFVFGFTALFKKSSEQGGSVSVYVFGVFQTCAYGESSGLLCRCAVTWAV